MALEQTGVQAVVEAFGKLVQTLAAAAQAL
jgi:hypothetical protein